MTKSESGHRAGGGEGGIVEISDYLLVLYACTRNSTARVCPYLRFGSIFNDRGWCPKRRPLKTGALQQISRFSIVVYNIYSYIFHAYGCNIKVLRIDFKSHILIHCLN